MAQTMLNGEELYPGDTVFDIVYGPGVVQSASAGDIHVSFGSRGRPRKYNASGVTGKLCYRTLYHRQPCIVEFPRDECNARLLGTALKDMMSVINKVAGSKCCPEAPRCPEGCVPDGN